MICGSCFRDLVDGIFYLIRDPGGDETVSFLRLSLGVAVCLVMLYFRNEYRNSGGTVSYLGVRGNASNNGEAELMVGAEGIIFVCRRKGFRCGGKTVRCGTVGIS